MTWKHRYFDVYLASNLVFLVSLPADVKLVKVLGTKGVNHVDGHTNTNAENRCESTHCVFVTIVTMLNVDGNTNLTCERTSSEAIYTDEMDVSCY